MQMSHYELLTQFIIIFELEVTKYQYYWIYFDKFCWREGART